MKSKILIVEDESIEAMNFEQLLTSLGYDVIGIASSGEDTVKKVAELKPDLILMDIVLKGVMDGIEAAAWIKEEFGIPVVYLTAHAEERAFDRAKLTMPYGYLIKPVIKSELKNIIELALYKHEMEIELIESKKFTENIIHSMSEGISILDKNGVHLDVNPSFCRMVGYSREELIGTGPTHSYWPEEEYENFQAILDEGLRGNQKEIELIFKRKDGEKFPVILNPSIITDDNGNIKVVYATVKDITERKKIDEAIKESEERFRTVANYTYDWEYWLSPEGSLLYISPSCERITGYTQQEFIKDPNLIEKIIYPDDIEIYHVHDREIEFNEKNSEVIRFRIITKQGEEKWIEHGCQPVYNNERIFLGRRVSNREITRQKQLEKELQDSINRYQSLIETNVDFIWEMDAQGRYTYCSPQMEFLWGFKPEEMLGKTPFDIMPNYDREKFIKKFIKMASFPIGFKGLETIAYDCQGNIIYVETSGIPFFDENNKLLGYRGISRDVTEDKKAEKTLKESENRFRMLFERSNAVLLLIEPDSGKIIDANPSASHFYGYPLKILKTMSMDDINQLPLDEIAEVRKKIKARKKNFFVFTHKLADCEIRTVEVYSSPINFKEGVLLFSIIHDITEKVKAENEIKSSLKEKEVLLKEIHHRVKNNLQIISSLLDLQEDYVKDNPTAMNVLKESQNRVMSMAMIHEMLYQSNDLSHINIYIYIKKMISILFDSYGAFNIKKAINIEEINLNIETAIPLGLITNELVSNCLKYAFPKKEGTISIELHPINKEYKMTISDNGIGIPKNIDFNNQSTLGLRLVHSLVKQIEGTIKLNRTKGTTYTITFNELKYKKRF